METTLRLCSHPHTRSRRLPTLALAVVFGTGMVCLPTVPAQATTSAALPVLSAALPVRTPDVSLTSQITDDAGLLTSTSSDAVASLAKRGVRLWVVTYSDASEAATDFAERAWQATGLGTSDLLLVINVADGARSYAFDGSASGSVWSSSKRDDVRAEVKERLSAGDWDGAVVAVADAGASGDSSEWGSSEDAGAVASGSSGSENAVMLGLGGVLALGGATAGYLAYRKTKRPRDRSGVGGGTGNTGDTGHNLPLPELAARAGQALIQADDAVRTAEEELAFAEAEFGTGGAEDVRRALQAAHADLEAAFAQRKLLDDDIPDTPAQQRHMNLEILSRTAHAHQVLQQPLADLAVRRAQETNLPTQLARTSELIATATAEVDSARRVLATLRQIYPADRVARLDPLPDQADALLHAAATAVEQSHRSYADQARSAALEQLRLAQHALSHVRSLTEQITRARERWEAEERQAVAQAAAAAQAAAQLPARLERLSTQVTEVDGYLATHRGVIGARARTALSEAHRLQVTASSQAQADPTRALEQVERAEQLVAQAQAAAEADVRRHRESHRDDDYRGGRGGLGGGLDLSSLILGGILLGNLGGHHHHWDDHGSGGWGGGGFGGGSFGGGSGGGGFGGGGGSF